jgi:hypothetical protein
MPIISLLKMVLGLIHMADAHGSKKTYPFPVCSPKLLLSRRV